MNDVNVGPDGGIYITDSGKNRLYKLQDGKIVIWHDSPNGVALNGTAVEGNMLILGSIHVIGIDPAKKNTEVKILAPDVNFGIDGIAAVGNGWYIVSSWRGEIKMVHSSGTQHVLLKYPDKEINTADFNQSKI